MYGDLETIGNKVGSEKSQFHRLHARFPIPDNGPGSSSSSSFFCKSGSSSSSAGSSSSSSNTTVSTCCTRVHGDVEDDFNRKKDEFFKRERDEFKNF
ncbi:hypothetical protein QVD17_09745 [Tagetes erecta]|uniref:Uncharacterized protein n=1 Tax=Tagetes erecta TaxID=13708 RepID=A0AAD8P474_TARER|nr:hypothetical protein QVD17_09745 [Tagetes erecta]